jgi:predicted RNA-binding protein with PUA-like domain
VRNYQARNHLRDMALGDPVLFYHSSADPPGVAGLAEVARLAYPDPSAFDPKDDHYDADSTPDDPRWFCVDVGFVEKFPRFVPLETLKASSALEGMLVTRRGMRLSVQPVAEAHFQAVLAMGRG